MTARGRGIPALSLAPLSAASQRGRPGLAASRSFVRPVSPAGRTPRSGAPVSARWSAQSAQVGIGVLSWYDADPGIHGAGTVRAGDNGIEVEFGDLGEILGQP